MPPVVYALIELDEAIEPRGYRYAGVAPASGPGMVATAVGWNGHRLQAIGRDEVDALRRLARLADPRGGRNGRRRR